MGIIRKIVVNNNATRQEPELKTEVPEMVQRTQQCPSARTEEACLRQFRARCWIT